MQDRGIRSWPLRQVHRYLYCEYPVSDSNELARRHVEHRVKRVELETGGVVGDIRVPRVIRRGLECSNCQEVIWVDEARPDEAFK